MKTICVFRTWTRGSVIFLIPVSVVPPHTPNNTPSGPDHSLKLFQVASCSFWGEATRTTQNSQIESHSFVQYHEFVFLSILLLIMPILLGFLASELMCSRNSAMSSDLPPRNLMASPETIIEYVKLWLFPLHASLNIYLCLIWSAHLLPSNWVS